MRRRALIVLPALLLSLAGCGDDLEERRADYLERAEAVCADSNAQARELGSPASVADVPRFAEAAVALVRATVDGLEALEPPEEDRAEVQQKVLEPLRDDVGTAEEYAGQVTAAAEANDIPTLLTLNDERPTTSADVDFMRGYGFEECVTAAQQGG
jgi:hypothetical protein